MENRLLKLLKGKPKLGLRKEMTLALDHYVRLFSFPKIDEEEVFVPMRIVQYGDGSEVVFTVFQLPDISGEKYAEDIKMVEQDLQNLKSIIEEITSDKQVND
jgi:hypothetical protein